MGDVLRSSLVLLEKRTLQPAIPTMRTHKNTRGTPTIAVRADYARLALRISRNLQNNSLSQTCPQQQRRLQQQITNSLSRMAGLEAWWLKNVCACCVNRLHYVFGTWLHVLLCLTLQHLFLPNNTKCSVKQQQPNPKQVM